VAAGATPLGVTRDLATARTAWDGAGRQQEWGEELASFWPQQGTRAAREKVRWVAVEEGGDGECAQQCV
jgi:hypothetical protein